MTKWIGVWQDRGASLRGRFGFFGSGFGEALHGRIVDFAGSQQRNFADDQDVAGDLDFGETAISSG